MPADIPIVVVCMDERLKEVAQKGDINDFYALIRDNPYHLECIDKIPFVQTPLHEAAAARQTQFALEMMRLKPSYSRKLNPDGFSPIHLALQKEDTDMVLRFLEVDPDLVRVKGREGITPLHYVAQRGDVYLLAKFLQVCPNSFEDLTIRSETALHIAAQNDKFEASEVMVGWLQRGFYEGGVKLKKKILNAEDQKGNTVLHIATSRGQPQVVKSLVSISEVDVNAKNLDKLTPLDILNRQTQQYKEEINDVLRCARALTASHLPPCATLADSLKSKMSWWDRYGLAIIGGRQYLTSENRNSLLVVVVLIATATYQAGLSPPGGVRPEKEEDTHTHESIIIYINNTTGAATKILSESSPPPRTAGKTVLNPLEFDSFALFNSLAFYCSLATIFILLPRDFFSMWQLQLLLLLSVRHLWTMQLISGKGFFFGEEESGIEIYVFMFSCIYISVLWGISYLARRKHRLLLQDQIPSLR